MLPISELLADHQEFHSDLQMDAFITLRSGGTLYGCYKQALRELATRVRALRERYRLRALLDVDLDELAASNPPLGTAAKSGGPGEGGTAAKSGGQVRGITRAVEFAARRAAIDLAAKRLDR